MTQWGGELQVYVDAHRRRRRIFIHCPGKHTTTYGDAGWPALHLLYWATGGQSPNHYDLLRAVVPDGSPEPETPEGAGPAARPSGKTPSQPGGSVHGGTCPDGPRKEHRLPWGVTRVLTVNATGSQDAMLSARA